MRVLVVGGTGFIGAHLCRELLERGHEVTAMSRSAEGVSDDVETVVGDVTDFDSIIGAFEGQDVVVNLVALSPLLRPSGGNETHFRVHRDGTENVVAAAKAAEVGRIVQLSALGADPDGDTAYIRAKGQAEAIVRESDLEWVIFRPSVVFGEGGEFLEYTERLALPYLTPLPGGGNTRFQPIWVDDLVPMLADTVEDEARAGEIYEVGGPETLTLAELARLVHGASGRSVNVIPIPMSIAGLGLKSLDFVPESVLDAVPGLPRMGSDQYRSLRFDNTLADNDVSEFDIDPAALMTVQSYLEEE